MNLIAIVNPMNPITLQMQLPYDMGFPILVGICKVGLPYVIQVNPFSDIKNLFLIKSLFDFLK